MYFMDILLFSSIQTVHVFIMVYFVSASQYAHEICVITKGTDRRLKYKIQNMNRFVYRLLRKMTVLRTFQTPLVCKY